MPIILRSKAVKSPKRIAQIGYLFLANSNYTFLVDRAKDLRSQMQATVCGQRKGLRQRNVTRRAVVQVDEICRSMPPVVGELEVDVMPAFARTKAGEWVQK
jgi:hypothetical protein